MLCYYKSESTPFDPMVHVHPTAEPLLKPLSLLRYDRSHAGSAAGDDEQRSAVELTPRGEADMEVSGPGSVGGGRPSRPAELRPLPEATSAAPELERLQDDEETGEAARMLERLRHDPQVRAERLAQIQAEIAAGTYETTEKLELAVERLLREIR